MADTGFIPHQHHVIQPRAMHWPGILMNAGPEVPVRHVR